MGKQPTIYGPVVDIIESITAYFVLLHERRKNSEVGSRSDRFCKWLNQAFKSGVIVKVRSTWWLGQYLGTYSSCPLSTGQENRAGWRMQFGRWLEEGRFLKHSTIEVKRDSGHVGISGSW